MTTPTPPAPTVAKSLPELPEPSAWVSLNVLTQKASVGKLPITSLQPGVYQNEKVFSEDQMNAHALSAISAHEAEVGRLLEALKGCMTLMGPKTPPCCQGCEYEWTEALKIIRAALTQGETK